MWFMVYMVCDCVCSYSRLLSGYVLLYALLHACFGLLIVLGLVLLLFDFTVILGLGAVFVRSKTACGCY